jgi:propanediol dehydratase small subunit
MSGSETLADYPLGETAAGDIRARSGRRMQDITVEAVLAGDVGLADLAIDAATLRRQAGIARAAGRETLARNFERAADLVGVPDEAIMRAYDLLRPGRAASRAVLDDLAREFRDTWAAPGIADFIAEAAEVYDRRGLFRYRF